MPGLPLTKSQYALMLAARAHLRGERVLFLDFEGHRRRDMFPLKAGKTTHMVSEDALRRIMEGVLVGTALRQPVVATTRPALPRLVEAAQVPARAPRDLTRLSERVTP